MTVESRKQVGYGGGFIKVCMPLQVLRMIELENCQFDTLEPNIYLFPQAPHKCIQEKMQSGSTVDLDDIRVHL